MIGKKRWLTFFLVSTLILNNVSAQLFEVSYVTVNPSVLWLSENPKITVSAKCKYNESSISSADVTVEIKSPNALTTTEKLWYSSGIYSANLPLSGFSEIGTYTASVTCKYGENYTDTKRKNFNVRTLELDIITEESEINVYMGDTIEIKADFRLDGNHISIPKDDFLIYVGEVEIDPVSVIGTTGYQKITADLCPSGKIENCMNKLPEGIYDLEITAQYSSDKRVTTKVKNYVRVHPPLKIDFSQSRVECAMGRVCNPEIKFDVTFPKGDISDFTEDDVEARILGNKFSEPVYVDGIQCNKQLGSCVVKLNIPSNLQPGSYDLYLSLKKKFGDGYYTIEDYLPLQVVLRISGVMRDAAGEVVGASISFINEENSQVITCSTDSSGGYSIDILPGKYSMEIGFGGALVRFKNITISSEDFLLGLSGDLIRYDEGHLNSGSPPGVRVIKVMVVEFALPFSSAWFYVSYNSALVNGDENNLRVYKCDKWNFEKGSCTGTWNELKADVHTIRNTIEFNSNSTAAFIIGEQRALYLMNIELGASKVFTCDTVVVSGKVLDSDGNSVEGAQIRLSFPEFGITSTDTSTTGGFFRASIIAPSTTGYPDLVVEAMKSSYASCNTTTTVEVDRKKEISIFNVPETVEVPLNEPTNINFRLFNSGQINLTQPIYISVTGIPLEWYRLSPIKVDTLDVSEQKNINLSITLNPELCDGGKCNQFSLVNIEAKSEEVSDIVSFTLKIASPLNQTTTASGGEPKGFFNLPEITGFSIALPSISNQYLPLTIVVILLVLIINKKKTGGIQIRGIKFRKKGKGAPKLRDSIMSSVHNIKKEI